MKKLFFLLLIPFVFACSDDKDKESIIDYIDNNIIAGKWVFVDGAVTYYMIFEENMWEDEIWHTYDKDLIKKIYRGEYKLSKTHIYYRTYGVPYIIENDVISLPWDGKITVSFTKVKD